MGKVYQSSRLSEGNKIFPTTIEVDGFGVTVKIPGLFGGKSETISYEQISSVKINTPLVGFSSITFDTTGWGRVTGTGFTKSEVEEIKDTIQQSKSQIRSGNPVSYSPPTQTVVQQQMEPESVQLRKLELQRERELEVKKSDEEFYNGIKNNLKKYWKVYVGIFFGLLVLSMVKDYLHKKESRQQYEETRQRLNK